MPNVIIPVGPSLWKLPASSGSFTIPTPPTPSAGTIPVLQPNWTAGPTGKHPHNPIVHAVLAGLLFCANGYDPLFFWDGGSNYFNGGSTVPTTFAANATGGSGWLAENATAAYRCVFRDTTRNRETAPQEVSDTATGSAQDVVITWTAADAEDGFDVAAIYRQLAGTGLFKLVTTVAVATATYTDTDADSVLETAITYVRTFRTTLPVTPIGVAAHQNRLWIWTGKDSNIHYSQQSRTDGEFRVDDFPSGNIEEIAPFDGDVVTAAHPKYTRLYIFKKRASYVLEGVNAANFVITQLFKDRGAFNQRCVLDVEGWTYFLDERGLYFTDLRGEPFVAGAANAKESPLEPIWKRLNRDASHLFSMFHSESEGLLYVHVALDHSQAPDTVICYDVDQHRFVSIDSGVPGFAAGRLEDAAGAQHDMRLAELGDLWEINTGNADGVFAGDTTATVTGGNLQTMTTDGAFNTTAASGNYGVPFDRYDSSGTVLDTNRVAEVAAANIAPLYWDDSAITAASDTVALGVIPFLAEFVKTAFNIAEKKLVRNVKIETDVESTASTLRVDTATDENSYTNRKELSLNGSKGRHIVPLNDRGWRWKMRFIMRYAGMDATVQALTVSVRSWKDRQ